MAMEKHFIQEGIIRSEVESFLKHELEGSGYSGINIQKTPLATRIILYVEKPPLVIGKRGRRINKLTRVLRDKYKIDNPAIDVQRIENPTLDPNVVARRVASALERGMNRRRVVYKAVRAVMSSRARGVEIVLAGKIVGKGGRARTERYLQGYMKKAGDPLKLVAIGSTQAYLKAGVIGVTVKIVPPGVMFPDQIDIIEKPKEVVEEVVEEIIEEVPDSALVEKAKGVKEEVKEKKENKEKKKGKAKVKGTKVKEEKEEKVGNGDETKVKKTKKKEGAIKKETPEVKSGVKPGGELTPKSKDTGDEVTEVTEKTVKAPKTKKSEEPKKSKEEKKEKKQKKDLEETKGKEQTKDKEETKDLGEKKGDE